MMQHLFGKPHMIRRCIVLVLSTCLMGVGVAIFDQIGFGTDPCSVLNLAVSRKIGWSYGDWLLTINVVIFALLLLMGEVKRFGLGSLANMVLVGYSADFTNWLLNMIHPLTGETLLVRSIVFVPAMIMFLLAVSFYMAADLGVAPYDAASQVIAGRQKRFSFAVIRVFWDVSVLVLGILMGGTVGIVTVVTGFFLGPVFAAIAKKIKPFFEGS